MDEIVTKASNGEYVSVEAGSTGKTNGDDSVTYLAIGCNSGLAVETNDERVVLAIRGDLEMAELIRGL